MQEIIRWEPRHALPELPFSAFEMTWAADRVLICRAYYGVTVPKEYQGAITRFDAVHAFASFDGFSDPLISYYDELIPLEQAVPYGGYWPFVEVQSSQWVAEIAAEHGGLDPTGWRHLAITTFDQTLHVMTCKAPEVEFWPHPVLPPT